MNGNGHDHRRPHELCADDDCPFYDSLIEKVSETGDLIFLREGTAREMVRVVEARAFSRGYQAGHAMGRSVAARAAEIVELVTWRETFAFAWRLLRSGWRATKGPKVVD